MFLRRILPHLKTALVLAVVSFSPAHAFETQARAAWVYDVTTHTVLMDKNADEPLPPASMSKLMTINMLFEALRDGRVRMDTAFAVSDRAVEMTRRGGSTMFLQHTDRPTVEDLIHGMIVNSGNDACIVVAEGLAGTEDAFSAQMTERARALGMTGSSFKNASGWPADGHRMSMRDLGILAQRLIGEFPEYYPIFAETEYDYKNRSPDNRWNRNPLLKLNIGADGLKTGHTQEAGYGLVGSAKQGNRRVIFAITGLPTEKARAEEAERIVAWAFRQFAEKTVAGKGVRVAEAEVFMGAADSVGLVPAEDLKLLVPALVQENVRAEVTYKGPLHAPLAAGEQVAEMVIFVPGLPERRVPLVTETEVARAGFARRLTTAAGVLWKTYVMGGTAAPAS
ncbi:D-alanyl-D-alanine carboxypeptidase family protein [Pseudogemmobacter humi]|uniref:serine-type D-Ala-D-Ala carboxypeptidase n=1 Tax=Pseudogemmobacter humi TaxID=2483812 RepID=A0A3P5XX38_9RHOB|nr:D-alanyl-D-alanine carboxypeptidase family protein [Pseudogemmobacter humi]VDC33740.1 D-alanyl-D-alanine carboxypeptidase DacC precursor [Pseudogemmobacter humi]